MSDEADMIEGLRTRVVRMIREGTGLHERFALPIASEIIDTFRREFGGERVYVPAGDPSIGAKVVDEFDGRNREELCRKYRISRATFYRFLQRSKNPSLMPPLQQGL